MVMTVNCRHCRVGTGPTVDGVSRTVEVASVQPRHRLSGLTPVGTQRDAFGRAEWGLLFAPALIWGLSFLFIAEGLKAFHPFVVTFGRIGLGALTLACFPSARRTKIDRADYGHLTAMSVTWLAFPMTLFPLAQQHISSGLAGMLNGSIPLFAALATSMVLRRAPGRPQQLGLALGVVGLALLGWKSLSDGGNSAVGVMMVVVACFSYGWAVTLNVPLTQKYGAVPVFWRCQLISTALTAPLGIFGLTGGRSEWNTRSAGALLILGAMGTAVAFVMMCELSARVGSTRASALTYLEAVIALAVGVLLANEPLVGLEVLGCAILLLGAWSSSRAEVQGEPQRVSPADRFASGNSVGGVVAGEPAG
jgi:drug/metabolite transporter (DMT)-like permease